MIGDDQNNMLGAFQVGAPLSEHFKDCKEFLVVNFIIEFGRLHRIRVEDNRMHDARGVVDLRYYAGNSVVGAISFNHNRIVGVEMGKNRVAVKAA